MAKIDFIIENGINNTNHICEYNNIKNQIYYENIWVQCTKTIRNETNDTVNPIIF